MKNTRIILLLIFVLSLWAGRLYGPSGSERYIDAREHLSRVAPDEVFGPLSGSPPHYLSEGGLLLAVDSRDAAPGIKGYAGPIRVLLAIDSRGTITGLEILSHHETPNYVRAMLRPSYLNQYIGKNITGPLVMDEDLDGISRATVSVKALAETVRTSGRRAVRARFGISGPKEPSAVSYGLLFPALYGLLVLTAFLTYLRTRKTRLHARRLRTLLLVASTLIVGLWLSAPLSVIQVYNTLIYGPPSDLLTVVILIAAVLSLVFAGRFYCGWLCPFGALSELSGRVKVKKWDITESTDRSMRGLKYWMLAIATATALFSAEPALVNIEPYVTMFSQSGTTASWLIAVVALLLSLRLRRPWCTYLCPVGALTALFARKTEGYKSYLGCPANNPPEPEQAECIRCNECYQSEAEQPGQETI